MVSAVQNYINPFKVSDADNLFCISSGRPVSEEIAIDLLSTDTHDTNAYKSFVQERLVQKTVSFNAPIKKLKFASAAVKTLVTSSAKKTKKIVAEREAFGQLILLSLHHKLCMDKVMAYPLGPVPWSLSTADEASVRTDKAKVLHKLEEGRRPTMTSRPDSAVHIIDENAMFQALSHIPKPLRSWYSIFLHSSQAPGVLTLSQIHTTNSVSRM